MLFFTLCWLWALGAFFSWLLCPSLTCSHFFIYLLVIFGALFYSLALQDDPCSLYIFPTLVIESAIFRRTPDFCYWRMLLEMKVYVLRVLFATEVLSLLSLHKHVYQPIGFLGGSDGKESAWNSGDLGSVPGSGRSPLEGNGYPLL